MWVTFRFQLDKNILPSRLVTCGSAMAGRLRTTLPTVSISLPVVAISLDCTNHLVGKGFERDADVKQAVTLWIQSFDTYFLYAELQQDGTRI